MKKKVFSVNLSERVAPFCDPSGDEGHVNWFEAGQKTIAFMLIANLSQSQSHQRAPDGGLGFTGDNASGNRKRGKPSMQNRSL